MEALIFPAIIVLIIFAGYMTFYWIASFVLLIIEVIDLKFIRPVIRWVSKKFKNGKG